MAMSLERQEWVTVFWTYVQRLEVLGHWFQQLWSESLGKATTRNGELAPRVSTLLPLVGPHSVLQQLHDGFNDKFILFIREKPRRGEAIKSDFGDALSFMSGRTLGELLSAECDATVRALHDKNVGSAVIEMPQASPTVLGELLMGLQLVVATLGEYLNVDAFNQPGVEQGKLLAREILISK